MPALKIATDRFRLIIGLGETGWSVARYLDRAGVPFAIADTRAAPPYAAELRRKLPKITCSLGGVDERILQQADEIVLSPGISHNEDFVRKAKSWGKPIISDISLFRSAVSKPVIAISGSNGKSTVTSLLAAMAARQQLNVAAGGNLGTPVLDLIRSDIHAYVIELSSFQLEMTHQLKASVACLLNVTHDHQDRYAQFIDYYRAKQKVFEKCAAAVYNKEDRLTVPLFGPAQGSLAVGLGPPDKDELGILSKKGEPYIAAGVDLLMPVKKIRLLGKHNLLNVMMALAVAQKAAWSLAECLIAAQEFQGLPHRCEWVSKIKGVDYINDSKATNPGAACTALDALSDDHAQVHIILGGASKQADFTDMRRSIEKHKAAAYLIGEEANRLDLSLGPQIRKEICKDLEDAVLRATRQARAGDLILLAPACASFDAYSGFAARGDHFKSLVHSLLL